MNQVRYDKVIFFNADNKLLACIQNDTLCVPERRKLYGGAYFAIKLNPRESNAEVVPKQ